MLNMLWIVCLECFGLLLNASGMIWAKPTGKKGIPVDGYSYSQERTLVDGHFEARHGYVKQLQQTTPTSTYNTKVSTSTELHCSSDQFFFSLLVVFAPHGLFLAVTPHLPRHQTPRRPSRRLRRPASAAQRPAPPWRRRRRRRRGAPPTAGRHPGAVQVLWQAWDLGSFEGAPIDAGEMLRGDTMGW